MEHWCTRDHVHACDLPAWPYAWLRPAFVPPSPFLVVKDPLTDASRILVEPHLIDAEFRKAWMPFFCRSGHPVVSTDQFLAFVGHLLPQEPLLHLPRITGRDLQEVARAKKSTAGGLDGWAWNEIEALSFPWFSGLAILLELVETSGVLESLGVGTVVHLRVVRLVWCSSLPNMSRGVVILRLCLMLSRSSMLIILSVVRSVLVPSFDAAGFTSRYARAVGQDVSPGKCVLLSTSKSVMKLWDISGRGGFWKVQLDVRDLCVILISLGGLGVGLFPKGLVRLFSGSLL